MKGGRLVHRVLVGFASGLVILTAGAIVLAQIVESMDAERRLACLNNVRVIGLSMIQYAGEYNEEYPDALDAKSAAKEPAQLRFAKLLKLGYLNNPKMFHCPAVPAIPNDPHKKPSDMSEADIAKAWLNDDDCSYGCDVKLKHTDGAGRVLVADRPHHDYWGTGVSSPNAGEAGSNSENHKGMGQNLMYNDGHVKWAKDCRDDSGVDPNIYAINKELKPEDDSNIDFGMVPEKKAK